MTKLNKIGFWVMIVSLISMLVVLLGFGDKVGYTICHIPLLIGLFMYTNKKL